MTNNQEVLIQGQVTIGATLTKPEAAQELYPAAVIIGGTGSMNRDGSGVGFKMNLYRDLAEELTELGFITLRYDKRGVGKTGGNRTTAGVTELVEDLKHVITFLKTQDGVDANRVILVGHSEGAILATLAAEQESVAGLILLSGAGASLKTSMEEQAQFLLKEVQETKGLKGKLLSRVLTEKAVVQKQQKLFERVTATDQDTIRIQLVKFPAKWLRQHLTYSDEDLLMKMKAVTIPILAVTGQKDVQTDYRNLEKVDDLNSEWIETEVISDMDHMLKSFTGRTSILDVKKQYRNEIGQPLHPELIQSIASWSLKNGIRIDHPVLQSNPS